MKRNCLLLLRAGLVLLNVIGRVSSDCTDRDGRGYCPWWASIGECSNNPCYMLQQCQSSCSDCQGEISLGSGNCSNNRTDCPCLAFHGRCEEPEIRSQCKKSCDTSCGEGGRDPDECVNDSSYCAFWASVGECSKNPTYMLEVCKPSCAECTVTTPTSLPGASRGTIVLRDDFDGTTLNETNWKYEISMVGGYNWEFQVYTKDSANIFLRDGKLYIKPTLTAYDPKFSESYLTERVMNVTELWGACTNSDNYGCVREGKYGLLPPVMSGKLMSKQTIKYGKVKVRAKIPKGDWIWPAIWMLPQTDTYGQWPASGEIDIMESRGNTVASDGTYNHGVNQVSSTLHWGPNASLNKFMKTHGDKDNAGFWSSDFHNYTLDWDADVIIATVDGQEVMRIPTPDGGFWNYGGFSGTNIWANGGENAPFDQSFYLILNVAIGGINGFFPDNWTYNTPKPYKNTSPTANADFWNKRSDWQPTWAEDDVAMIVDYVEMTKYD